MTPPSAYALLTSDPISILRWKTPENQHSLSYWWEKIKLYFPFMLLNFPTHFHILYCHPFLLFSKNHCYIIEMNKRNDIKVLFVVVVVFALILNFYFSLVIFYIDSRAMLSIPNYCVVSVCLFMPLLVKLIEFYFIFMLLLSI